MTNSLFKAVLGAALISASTLAIAVPMDGGISFSSQPGTTFTFDDTQFDFDSDIPNATVNAVSGDFGNYFATGDQATFYDFTYNPDSAIEGTKIWDAVATQNGGSTVSFILESLTMATFTPGQPGLSSAVVEGTGILTDGINQVAAAWNITANEASSTFSWSSSTAALPARVPEPSTLGLLGLALAGMGMKMRRKLSA